jgi:hypothetical protein
MSIDIPDMTVYVLVLLRQITFMLYIIRTSKEIEQAKGTYVEITEEQKRQFMIRFVQMILLSNQ